MSEKTIEGTTFECAGYNVSLECGQYGNRRLAIKGMCDDGTPYGVLTVNVPEIKLNDREIIIKPYSENQLFAKAALETGLFNDTGKRFAVGYTEVHIWKIMEGVNIK